MKATISAREPNILRDATPGSGETFLVHTPALQECVCGRTYIERTLSASEGPRKLQTQREVVVIACRVPKGEPGFHALGALHAVDENTPITFVEQIEAVAFRQRTPIAPIGHGSLSHAYRSFFHSEFGSDARPTGDLT